MKKRTKLIFTIILGLPSFFLNAQNNSTQLSEKETQEKAIKLINERIQFALDLQHLTTYSLNNSTLMLFSHGFWSAQLGGEFSLNITKTKTTFHPQLLFNQNSLFSLWALVDNQWYVESQVFDDIKKSIFGMGYFGSNNSPLKHIRIGNSGILFPNNYPFIRIGGDRAISPGIMGTFVGTNWQADTLLRYDSGKQQTKTFYGNTEQQTINRDSTQWARGRFFYLPNCNAVNTLRVFVETENDIFIELSTDRFSFNTQDKILHLYTPQQKRLAVYYDGCCSVTDLATEIKQYINIIRNANCFSEIKASISEATMTNYTKNINGKNCLLIKKEKTFSPFEVASRYSLDTKIETSIFVKNRISGQHDTSFKLQTIDTIIFAQHLKEQQYLELSLAHDNSATEPLIKKFFPFYKKNPAIYYPENSQKKSNYQLSYYQYIPAESFYLSENVRSASVSVFRNGIQDFNFKYDHNTKRVILEQPPLTNEKITITWQSNNDYAKSGKIVAGLGAHYYPLNELDLFAGTALHWNPNNKGFSRASKTTDGTFITSLGLNYQKNGLALGTSSAFNLHLHDVKTLCSITSMNPYEADFVLSTARSGLSLTSSYQSDTELIKKDIVKKLNPDNNNTYAKIAVKNNEVFSITDSIIISKKLETISIHNYQNLSFFIKDLDLLKDHQIIISFSNNTTEIIKANIDTAKISNIDSWNKITFDLKNKTLFVNDAPLSDAKLEILNNFLDANLFTIKIIHTHLESNQEISFYIDELFLTKAILTPSLKNKTFVEYNKELLLEKNNIPIFSNLQIYGETNIRHNFEAQHFLFSGVLNSTLDIWKTHIAGGLSITPQKNTPLIESYFHDIKLPVYYFYAHEYFFVNKHQHTLNRSNELSFKKYIEAVYQNDILYENYSAKQRYAASFSPLIPESSYGNFNIQSSLELSQVYPTVLKPSSLAYHNVWKQSLIDMYSLGEQHARYRNEKISFFCNWEHAPTNDRYYINSVNFFAESKSHFSQSGLSEKNEITTYSLSIPLTLDFFKINFFLERKALRTQKNNMSKNYFDDYVALFNGIKKMSWLFSSLHFYDLFDKNILTKMNYAQSADTTYIFSNYYLFGLKRQFFNDHKDLWIPFELQASAKRLLFSKNNITDSFNNYQFTFSLQYISLDIFSKHGIFDIKKSYETDEFNRFYSLKYLALKSGHDITFKARHNFLFRLCNDKEINIKNNFLIRAKKQLTKNSEYLWEQQSSFAFSWKGGKSLTELIIKKFSNILIENRRTVALAVSVFKKESETAPVFAINLKHEQQSQIGTHGHLGLFIRCHSTFLPDSTEIKMSAGLSGEISY